MKTFKNLKFNPHRFVPGVQALIEFPNGYGASVVQGPLFYGGEKAYELAVMKGGKLCYTTPVTDDVIGHLDEAGVTETMAKIQELPAEVAA